ncbi:MAG: alpha/beta hydrolase [Elusimicrobiota bacterium]
MMYIYVLFIGVLVFFFFYKWLDGKFFSLFTNSKKNINFSPEDLRMVYEPVYFKSQDGIELSGWFIPKLDGESDTTVIVGHGAGENKSDALKQTSFLAKYFNLLYFDFRACGESKGKICSYGFYESRDILGAYDFLKTVKIEFARKVGLYSSSCHSFAGVDTFCKTDIDFLILKSPSINFFKFLRKYAKEKIKIPFLPEFFIKKYLKTKDFNLELNFSSNNLNRPIIFIYGDKDEFITLEEFETFYNSVNLPSKNKILLVGGSHFNIPDIAYFSEKLIENLNLIN